MLLETAVPFDATTIVGEETEAKYEAERRCLGLVIFMDGLRAEGELLDMQSLGRKARRGTPGPPGHKVHMGFEQEAYGAECAAIARALETAARRRK